jgi:hypothetical protein
LGRLRPVFHSPLGSWLPVNQATPLAMSGFVGPEADLGEGVERGQQVGPPEGMGEDQPVRWRSPVRIHVAAEEPGLEQFGGAACVCGVPVEGMRGQCPQHNPGDQVGRRTAWGRSASIVSAHLADKIISIVTVTAPDHYAAVAVARAVVSATLKRQAMSTAHCDRAQHRAEA